MATTAREMLDQIDEFLDTAADVEARKLWSALTGLRGPDDDDHKAKTAISAVIRGAAFPRMLAYANGHAEGRWSRQGMEVGEDDPSKALFRDDYLGKGCSTHFWGHAWNAFNALGLKF